jgi:hypothetical protein
MVRLRSAIWSLIGFVVGVVGSWLTDDLGKPLFETWVEEPVSRSIPWESSFVQWIIPNRIIYEATMVSGCSGGGLDRLVSDAKKQGMKFRDEELVKKTFLCDAWKRTGTAASILDAMASAYKNCFVVTGDGADREFEVQTPEPYVCKTNYVIDPQTNHWVSKPGNATILCLTDRLPGPPSTEEPYARACPSGELRKVGIAP